MDNRLRTLIEAIRQNPNMYLGVSSIFRFYMFLWGYVSALIDLDGAEKETFLLETIQKEIANRYKFKISQSWDAILWFVSRDEREALDLFWNIWDAHIVRKHLK